MPCHVLMTSNARSLGCRLAGIAGAAAVSTESVDLIGRIAGAAGRRESFGARLAKLAEGLPGAARACIRDLGLRGASRPPRRGVDHADARRPESSFLGVYQQLEAPAQLLLHAAGEAEPAAHPARRAAAHLAEGAGWSTRRIPAAARRLSRSASAAGRRRAADASAVRVLPARQSQSADEVSEPLRRDRSRAGAARCWRLRAILPTTRTSPALAASLLAFPTDARPLGRRCGRDLGRGRRNAGPRPLRNRPVRGGAALVRARGGGKGAGRRPRPGRSREPGRKPAPGGLLPVARPAQYEAARPWFERAVAEEEQGDVHGRVDHASLGSSLHQVGYCLSQTGRVRGGAALVRARGGGSRAGRRPRPGRSREPGQQACTRWATACRRPGEHAAARPWYERAVAEKEQGDVHGRVDHASLGSSLHQVGYCLRGQYEPRPGTSGVRNEQGDVTAGRSRVGQACTRWATACRRERAGPGTSARAEGAGRRPRPGRSREPGQQPAPSGRLPVADRAVRGGAALVRARGGGEGAGRRPRPGRSREPGKQPAPSGRLPVADRGSTRRRGPGSSARWRRRSRATSTAGSITRAWEAACTRWATACHGRGSTRRRCPGSSARWRKRSRATSTAGSITRAWESACTRWATACHRRGSTRRRCPGSSARWRRRSRATSTAGSITRA